MDSEKMEPKGVDFVKTMKIAMAMAILRSKPAGTSGEQYTTQLVSEFQASQLHWKRRSCELQKELLTMKQQLLLSKIPESETIEDEDLLQNGQPFSEDSASSGLFPTPPSSWDEVNMSHKPSLESQLSQHVNFLQSMIGLQGMTRHLLHQGGKSVDLHELTCETLCHTLDGLQESITDPQGLIPHACLLHAVRVVISIIQGDNIRHLDDIILGKTAEMLQKLVLTIVNDQNINTVELQEKRCELLIEFGRCPHLKHGVLKLLSRCVQDYSDILRRCCTHHETIHPHTFENMAFIIRSFETLLEAELQESLDVSPVGDSQMQGNASSPSVGRTSQDSRLCLPLEVIEGLESEMENSLLHITQRFPLFTHALWHIGALLQLLKQKLT